MVWRSMLESLIRKWTQQHLIAGGRSPGAQWASLPPPSWTPEGRSPHRYPQSVRRQQTFTAKVAWLLRVQTIPVISVVDVERYATREMTLVTTPTPYIHSCAISAFNFSRIRSQKRNTGGKYTWWIWSPLTQTKDPFKKSFDNFQNIVLQWFKQWLVSTLLYLVKNCEITYSVTPPSLK